MDSRKCGTCKQFHFMNYRDGSGFLTSWCDIPKYRVGKIPKLLDFKDAVCKLYIQRWPTLDHSKCPPNSICKSLIIVRSSKSVSERFAEHCEKFPTPELSRVGTLIRCSWCKTETRIGIAYCLKCGHRLDIEDRACDCIICGSLKLALLFYSQHLERERAKRCVS